MLGGMFAGSDEAAQHDDSGNRVFYGMSSDTAMNKFSGGVATYRASEGKTIKPEDMERARVAFTRIEEVMRYAGI